MAVEEDVGEAAGAEAVTEVEEAGNFLYLLEEADSKESASFFMIYRR